MKWAPLVFLAFGFLTSCNEKKPANGMPPTGKTFLYYSLSGEEGMEEMTCKFEFREGSAEGHSITLLPPASLTVDGQPVTGDSTRFSGAYYEKDLPISEVGQPHEVVFTAADGKSYREQLRFQPYGLKEELPASVRRAPFTLEILNPPAEGSKLQLILVDTSFESTDVNEEVFIKNGSVAITDTMLTKLVNGPVVLELHLEETRKLQDAPRAGGRFTIFYAIKREFELQD